MSIDVSVCGLIVIPGRESQGFECALRQVELAELDLSVALNFARSLIRDEAEVTGLPGVSIIAAAFHPGKVEVCPGLEYADQPVNPDEERREIGGFVQSGPLSHYTVCGFYADNWQTYSGYEDAETPRMAYLQAWRTVADTTGRYLYVAGVHPGEIPRHPLPGTSEPPAFGDPTCLTAAAMTDVMNTLMGVS